jgi:hypothetical protein
MSNDTLPYFGGPVGVHPVGPQSRPSVIDSRGKEVYELDKIAKVSRFRKLTSTEQNEIMRTLKDVTLSDLSDKGVRSSMFRKTTNNNTNFSYSEKQTSEYTPFGSLNIGETKQSDVNITDYTSATNYTAPGSMSINDVKYGETNFTDNVYENDRFTQDTKMYNDKNVLRDHIIGEIFSRKS